MWQMVFSCFNICTFLYSTVAIPTCGLFFVFKINPQHTIPTLIDDDFVIWDSHAITAYLVEKYAADDSLYPKDLKKRALVDQRLHFDSGILFPRVHNLVVRKTTSQQSPTYFSPIFLFQFPIVTLDEKEISKEKLSAINEAYSYMNTFLENQEFIAGDGLTIADFCCVSTVSTATIIIPISAERFPNLSKWYHRCKGLPYYDEGNGIGLNRLDTLVETKLGKPLHKECNS